MKKSILAAFALAALTLTSCKKETTTTEASTTEVSTDATSENTTIEGDSYTVQTADAKVNWEGGKVSGDKHMGTIAVKEGNLIVKDAKVVGGKFVLDMNTITATDIVNDDEKKGMLEGHLKGTGEPEGADHFFNVNQFPTSTFEITNVTEENGKQKIEGNLTIKDKTNPISFLATTKVDGDNVTLVSDEIVFDRTKFNVNYNSGTLIKDLAADKIIKDDIIIKVELSAKK